MIPIKDYPGERRLYPWVMLSLHRRSTWWSSGSSCWSRATPRSTTCSKSAGVVPVEYSSGVEVGPPPPFGLTWTTLFTSMFLHGGLLHIASNMLYLFVFGDNVEDRLGHVRFLIFYFVCGIAAGLTHIAFNLGLAGPERWRLGRHRGGARRLSPLFSRTRRCGRCCSSGRSSWYRASRRCS